MAADLITAFTAAVSTLAADFGDILIVAAGPVLAITVGLFLYRRAKGLVK